LYILEILERSLDSKESTRTREIFWFLTRATNASMISLE